MKKLKILAVVLALMMGLCVFSGCSDAEVKLGHYFSKDGNSLVTVKENELDFSYNVAVSYIPYGPYTIKYNRLTLQVGGGDFAGGTAACRKRYGIHIRGRIKDKGGKQLCERISE